MRDRLQFGPGKSLRVEPDLGRFLGHSVNRQHGVPIKRGAERHGALPRVAEAAGVTLITGAQVTKLHADGNDRASGVTFARGDGATESVGAGSVILATRGFGANEEMVRRNIPDLGVAACAADHRRIIS